MKILDQNFDIFITSDEIHRRIVELSSCLNRDYANKNPIFLSVLNGAFMFTADFLREVVIPSEVSFIKLKSYKKMESSGRVKELLGLENNIFDRHIIIVEDIVDTGTTLLHMLNEFKDLGAKSIEILTLLHKPKTNRSEVDLKYVGFEIPNEFIVGYGLDYDGYGRNLKDIFKINGQI